MPPTVASQTIAVSASCHARHRSSGSTSASATARITDRMSNGSLRSGLVLESKTSPTVVNPDSGRRVCGEVRTSRSTGSFVGLRRGKRSPGTVYVKS